jgi:hypothetical protein
MNPNITPAMRSVIERMGANWRLSVRPAWFKAWLDDSNGIASVDVHYGDVTALEELKLIEVQEIAPPLWRMRLTEAGRELLKGQDDGT